MPLGRGMITSTLASDEPLGDAHDRCFKSFLVFTEGNKAKMPDHQKLQGTSWQGGCILVLMILT